jgi:hypothetical protein
VSAHLEVILRATAIFVADVAFANIACKYDDFLRSMENACLTMTHDTPYRSSRDAASLISFTLPPNAAACGIARFRYHLSG